MIKVNGSKPIHIPAGEEKEQKLQDYAQSHSWMSGHRLYLCLLVSIAKRHNLS